MSAEAANGHVTEPPLPDYLAMTAAEMLAAVRDDARKWADAFCQAATQHGLDIDRDWMIGWFANAIENSHTIRTAPNPAQMSLGLPVPGTFGT